MIHHNGLVYTDHAVERMAEMSLTPTDVEDCVSRPEVVYATPRYGATTSNSKRGKITVAHDGNVIITILWNTQETYVRKGK